MLSISLGACESNALGKGLCKMTCPCRCTHQFCSLVQLLWADLYAALVAECSLTLIIIAARLGGRQRGLLQRVGRGLLGGIICLACRPGGHAASCEGGAACWAWEQGGAAHEDRGANKQMNRVDTRRATAQATSIQQMIDSLVRSTKMAQSQTGIG